MSPQAPRPPAPQPPADRRFAKDVAKHLDRRRMRRKLLLWALVVGALVLAALYATCGRGFGLGFGGKGEGKGEGEGEGEGEGPGSVQTLISPADAGPRRCEIRIAASGITADGKPATVDEAVAACKGATVAEVLVTGGARQGDLEDVEAAFARAGIQFRRVESKGDGGDGRGAEPAAGSGEDGGSDPAPTGGR